VANTDPLPELQRSNTHYPVVAWNLNPQEHVWKAICKAISFLLRQDS